MLVKLESSLNLSLLIWKMSIIASTENCVKQKTYHFHVLPGYHFFPDCPIFLCFQVSCAHEFSARPTGHIYKVYSFAGSSLHGLTSSFFLISMHATLKHLHLCRAQGESPLSVRLFFVHLFHFIPRSQCASYISVKV